MLINMFPLNYLKLWEEFICLKKAIMEYGKDRLERSPYNFEWNHNTLTYISNNTAER